MWGLPCPIFCILLFLQLLLRSVRICCRANFWDAGMITFSYTVSWDFFLLCLCPAIGMGKIEDFLVRISPPLFFKEVKQRRPHFWNITHEFRWYGYLPCTAQYIFVGILFAVNAHLLYSNQVPADPTGRAV